MSHAIAQRSSQGTDALIPTVVLYDVMREAANRLRGELVRLADLHPALAEVYRLARLDIVRRADAVDAHDRVAITAMDSAFRAELDELLTA